MPNLSEIGQSGLQRMAGIITEEEFLPALRGQEAIRTYREMRDNDPIIGAIFYAIECYIRQIEWTTEAFSEDDEDVKNEEFLKECMDDMSMTWSDVICEALTCLEYGWAVQEIVYKRRSGPQKETGKTPSSKYDDGKIGWRKMPLRAQVSLVRWDFDEEGGIQAMLQRPAPTYDEIELPIQKCLLFRTTVKLNNPEGRSLLRNAYRPWYYKKRIEEIEGVGIERDLAGMPMAEVDPAILNVASRTPEETAIYNAIASILTGVRRDSQDGIMWPMVYDDNGNQLYKFSLMSAGGSRQFDTSGIIERYVKQIAMTVLADFIMLGHESVGSFALADSKTAMFAVALGSIMQMMEEVFNRYAVPRLFEINGMDTTRLPKIVHGDIEKQDLAGLASYVTSLAQAGMALFPDKKLDDYLREAGGLPEASEDGEAVPTANKPTEQDDNGDDADTEQNGGGSDYDPITDDDEQ